MWWDWAKTPQDIEAMTWAEFHGLFISTYFMAKAKEFLELRQGTMIVMEYVARFTELARYADNYVATDLAKVRRFENGLKLSIRGKIVGLRLQDMDSMVGTALAIERERDGGRTGHSGCEFRWEKKGGSAFFEFRKETEELCPTSALCTGPARADDMFLLPSSWAHEMRLSTKARIPELWDSAVLVMSGTSAEIVSCFLLQCGSEELVSVAKCYSSTFGSTDRPDRPEGLGYGSRSGTGFTGQNFEDPGACLRRSARG